MNLPSITLAFALIAQDPAATVKADALFVAHNAWMLMSALLVFIRTMTFPSNPNQPPPYPGGGFFTPYVGYAAHMCKEFASSRRLTVSWILRGQTHTFCKSACGHPPFHPSLV